MQFTDQLHRIVTLNAWPPRRIVSLVPSQTELLADLGLEQEVVGLTKFCVHPEAWFQNKARVGGTKTLNLPKIEALHPDLIIGNKEENDREQIEQLMAHFPVWMSDIADMADALDMIRALGRLTDRSAAADRMAADIQHDFEAFTRDYPPTATRVAYLIWRKPYMVAAAGTFVHEMLVQAGFVNVFERLSRYPEIALTQLVDARPDLILLSSEPYPFAEKHIAALQAACPGAKVLLVDGEMFSWYGSRLKKAPDYLRRLRELSH